MSKLLAVCFFSLILFSSSAIAKEVPPVKIADDSISLVAGDNPLTVLYGFEGQCDFAYAVATMGNSGSLDLTTLPADATVLAAYFISGFWFAQDLATHSMSFTFNGAGYGAVDAISVDTTTDDILDLAGFAVDVTSEVTGNASYTYFAEGVEANFGDFGHLLAVVYSTPALPYRALQLLAGAESLMGDSSTANFDLVGTGGGTLHVFTEADQAGASSGEESISFNGALVAGGPEADLFANNNGEYLSFLTYPVTLQEGTNSVTITTGEDWFGWHFAALVGPAGTVETERTSLGKLKSNYR